MLRAPRLMEPRVKASDGLVTDQMATERQLCLQSGLRVRINNPWTEHRGHNWSIPPVPETIEFWHILHCGQGPERAFHDLRRIVNKPETYLFKPVSEMVEFVQKMEGSEHVWTDQQDYRRCR